MGCNACHALVSCAPQPTCSSLASVGERVPPEPPAVGLVRSAMLGVGEKQAGRPLPWLSSEGPNMVYVLPDPVCP
jgi:hypothetical protein